jgi:hypothetical protein
MSAVERPTYFERQILSAADLDTQVAYSRGALARHERYQHSWGVMYGLGLAKTSLGFTIAPGVLVDGTGRQVVLDVEMAIPHHDFDVAGVFGTGDTDKTWFPVFIVGADEPRRPPPFKSERCGTEGTTRVSESFVVQFGRPGAELNVPQDPAVGSGPGGAQGAPANEKWPVLVGFVQWDPTQSQIKDAQTKPEKGKAPRYSGVYADSVAARGGSLVLRTSATPQSGKPVLNLQEQEAILEIGTLNPNGSVKPLMTLNDKGDLEVVGKVKGTLAAGSLVAESGVASDGMTIALPAGVTQQQVDDGEAQIHVIPSLLADATAAPDNTSLWIATPLDCFVDAQRAVHCRVRWLELVAATPRVVDRPASCSYLIVASIKQK